MNPAQKITDTEWEIMRAVWARHPVTAFEIIEKLAEENPRWHPKTVRTLLARLVKKGVLSYTSRGKVYFYEPLASEQECITTASESFIDRVFAGSLKPMLVHFVERRELTRQELNELRQLLDPNRNRRRAKRKDE